MNRLALVLALGLAALGACGSKAPATATTTKPEPPPAAPKILVNVDEDGTGILGFDAVAYMTDNKVTPGSGDHAVAHGGANYWFASPEHETAFAAEPAKFAPQYGGYCAYAMSQGRLSPIQPEVYEIYEGQLLLFTNPEFKRLFDKDPAKNKALADQNWPKLVEEQGKLAPAQ
jgi:YHS domain-containing protein